MSHNHKLSLSGSARSWPPDYFRNRPGTIMIPVQQQIPHCCRELIGARHKIWDPPPLFKN